jgi:hypothetical protein
MSSTGSGQSDLNGQGRLADAALRVAYNDNHQRGTLVAKALRESTISFANISVEQSKSN